MPRLRIGGDDNPYGAYSGGYAPTGYGSGFTPHSSRPDVQIPIWEDAHSYEGGAYKLKIQRREADGELYDIGSLPADANEGHLLTRWPKPGRYEIMPVDEHGQAMRDMPYVKQIAADHWLLRQIQGQSAPAGMMPGMPGMPPMMMGGGGPQFDTFLAWMKEERERAERAREEERREMREMMAAIREREERLAQRETAMAVERESGALELQSKLIDSNQARAEANQSALVGTLTAMQSQSLERLQAMHAMTMQQIESSREAERARAREERDRAREEAAAERRRRDEEEKAARAEAQRIEKEREERLATERQRDREWREAQLKQEREWNEMRMRLLEKEKDPLSTVEGLVTRLAPLASMFGIDSIDKVKELLGGGPKGTVEVIAGTIGEVLKAQMMLQAGDPSKLLEMMQDEDEDEDEMVAVQVAPGQIIQMPRSQFEAAQAQQQQAAVQAFAKDPAQATAAAAPQPAATPMDVFAKEPANGAGKPAPPQVDLKIAKPARKALRMLVGELQGLSQEQWPAKIVEALKATAEIGPYFQAVTVRHALEEAGAAPDVVTAVLADPLVRTFAQSQNVPLG